MHVLGPAGTDSVAAARAWHSDAFGCNARIRLCDTYTELFDRLPELRADFVVMPAGYVDDESGLSWVDLHFASIDKVTLICTFMRPTKPMAVFENTAWLRSGMALQPATRALSKASGIDHADRPPVYFRSKPLAFEAMLHEGYRYAIGSVTERSETLVASGRIVVRKTFNPTMVWCVYVVC
ncbi:type 2 periplasmic-binding domain-containing protein [Clavibacter capsici]|uniref:hypothetical protein n=1 Tax=Clavibacter capsici TaxID=1874630 RepID=UPI0014281DC2|nr:hypothetical protein [Clavibacter capsici]QIS38448.1 hypothetical protein GW572_03340 [Clavibacter capsici]